MNKFLSLIFLTLILSCNDKPPTSFTLSSPSGNNSIYFQIKNGKATYFVKHGESLLIDTSLLSFEIRNEKPLEHKIKVIGSETREVNEDWEMPWGEQRLVNNHYQELLVELQESRNPRRKMNLYFRAYDDGVAFRYVFPQQEAMDTMIMMEENTHFNLTGDHTVWWTPGDWDIYEHLYNTTPFSQINALSKRDHPNLAQTHIPENAVNTPLTMRTADGLHLSFHEANLTDYAGMTLKVDPENLKMVSGLVGSNNVDYKVKRALPFATPWRTIQIAEEAKDLLASNLIVNLNEPNRLGDISWFKPKKYMGIWWELHLGKSSWNFTSGKHGATTENAKHYIDFAAANNIGGILVEGWNTGWENWFGIEEREGIFDFVTPYPDYDLEEVVRYANEKGVELIMHHETSSAPRTYEQQLDTAYALMQRLGIHSVKTGYVGTIVPKGEYHHGQWMVQHYRKVLETAAKYEIAINAHEPIKATGIRRTLPNAISREGLRGQEFNVWSVEGGNPPEHLSIVAFTRMLAGPIDFTPGVFDTKLKEAQKGQVNTTLAHQLALYVIINSPIQMACDLPEHYEGHPAFQFIRDVGVNWEQTKVLDGEVGDFVSIARQERGSGHWFVGAITDENPREIKINFDFLEPGKDYQALIYRDAAGAHWDNNPTAYEIENVVIRSGEERSFGLAAGGGVAVSLRVGED